ncbi:MAG: hypothetical protein V7756_04595 [Halopseudomonas sp.]|uniref:hypothetical protein n=1 Tax=Halopseudomonas sp. TaxID=2901191 RepID=UPI00300278F8
MNATSNLIEDLRNELVAVLGESPTPEQTLLIDRADAAIRSMPINSVSISATAFELGEFFALPGGLSQALSDEAVNSAILNRALQAFIDDAGQLGHFFFHDIGASS